MAPRNTRRRRRGRATNTRSFIGPQWFRVSDWVGGVENVASSSAYRFANFSLPPDRAFKIIGFELQAVPVEAHSSCFQVRVYGPVSNTQSIYSTGPIVVGANPLRRFFRVPRVTPWPAGVDPTTTLIVIDQICQVKSESDQLRFVMRVDFLLAREEFVEACPTRLSLGSANEPHVGSPDTPIWDRLSEAGGSS